MEAVTSTDYDSSNLSRNFNQVGFNTYNYSQFEEKYKPRQVFKYGDEYLEYGRNSVRLGPSERLARLSSARHQEVAAGKIDQRYARSHSQPERQHHSSHETRSKSQDSRELTFYQIDPPVPRPENVHSKTHRGVAVEKGQGKKELTFYEIDGPASQEKAAKDGKSEGGGGGGGGKAFPHPLPFRMIPSSLDGDRRGGKVRGGGFECWEVRVLLLYVVRFGRIENGAFSYGYEIISQ